MRIEIPQLAPGINTISRMHWAQRRRLKRDWTVLLREAIGSRVPKYDSCDIRITRYTTGQMDPDNLTSTAKFVLDGLKRIGVIEDDNPDVIQLEVDQVRVSKRREQKTVITLTDPAVAAQVESVVEGI